MWNVKTIPTFIIILLTGCGQEQIRDHITGAPTKPFTYALEAELSPYWDRFTEVIGVPSRQVAGFFTTLDVPTVGLCTSYSEGLRKIEIDPTFWAKSNPLTREQLIFHELGHCVLNLDHNSNMIDLHEAGQIPESIMYPYVFGDQPYYEEYRNYYLKELKP